MGLPIAGEFDVGVTRPIDSRMVWTGLGTNASLNNIPNKYPGLTCYVTGDQNLYVFQGNNIWEKIITNNVDVITNINSNFHFNLSHHGQVLYVDSPTNVTGALPSVGLTLGTFPSGYNVSIIQLGDGNVVITGSGAGAASTFVRNRINLNRTAGKYAVASILRLNQAEFLLYGDLI